MWARLANPRAGVVDRQPYAARAKVSESGVHLRVVVNAQALGELDHDAGGIAGIEHAGELGLGEGLGAW